jgi:predicted Rossmann fold nucleotide-binding protein DprA/Smf involved in DNA uptake
MKYAPILLTCLFISSAALFAEAPQPGSDLRKTLSAAAEQKKMGFILLGRATCGNCNATRAMIREGKIPVTSADYVMADLNVDDQKIEAEFMRKYSKEKFGEVLPFVVVTDSHGAALASSSGMKNAQQWTTLLTEAKAKAEAKSGGASTTGAGTDSNWPFKSAPTRQ